MFVFFLLNYVTDVREDFLPIGDTYSLGLNPALLRHTVMVNVYMSMVP